MIIEKALKELGLSEKEAKVYLAALELGPQPVQEIAKKAGVNRATTYVMIESLTKRGLMSSFDKGKKRFFTAEDPDRLLNVIRSEKEELKQKEDLITKMLPELMAVSALSEEHPRVRYFEGREGSRDIMRDIIDSRSKELRVIADLDEFNKLYTKYGFAEERKEMKRRNIVFKEIIVSSFDPESLNVSPPNEDSKMAFVPREKFNFTGELMLYDKKVAMFAYHGIVMAVIIESPEINKMIRSIFDVLWERYKEYEIK